MKLASLVSSRRRTSSLVGSARTSVHPTLAPAAASEPSHTSRAWQSSPGCQQCRRRLTDREKALGRICDRCVSVNRGVIYDASEEN